jgi:hypothetical protein
MLTLDPGYSDTKIIWRAKPTSPVLLLMSPHVVEVSREAIEAFKRDRISNPNPEDEAWVEFDGHLYAVGSLARNHFKAKMVMDDLKYELAIAKVLAACGVMSLREGLGDEFPLALTVPLPFAEWQSRLKFEPKVKNALSNFSFCDKPMQIPLRVFMCVPEGGGHAITRGDRLGEAFNKGKYVALMLGYRDLSIVVFNLGIPEGQTERLGFKTYVEIVQSRTAGHTSEERTRRLLETIHQAGKDFKLKNFKHLALSRNRENQEEEIEHLVEVIKSARSEYWTMVSQYLINTIPKDVSEIIVGGGGSDYLRSELQGLFSHQFRGTRVSWSAELEEDVKVALNLPPSEKALSTRLTDAFALSRFMYRQLYPTGDRVNA